MSLLNFIPADRAFALVHDTDLPERCFGSALFADISGFTPLTETLSAKLGLQRSAEELTNLLNRVYTALMEQVALYGGSVTGFVGDAITCWFDESTGAGAVLRAAACAVSMQQTMRQFSALEVAPGVTASIQIKIGLASGEARRFVAGDPAIHLMDALAGETIRQMAQAEGLAQSREILLTPGACAELRGLVSFEERRHPETGQRFGRLTGLLSEPGLSAFFPELETLGSALNPAVLQPWILPGLRERLRLGSQLLLPQLRPAVALFVRFSDIDYDHDPLAGQKLKDFIAFSQGIIHRQGGDIIQLTIGDKGSFFYAAFGAPIAHGDDALRAVRAALELQKRPQTGLFSTGKWLGTTGLSLQIGLASGQARTGIYGGHHRFSYGVIGQDVILACRLMQAAPPGEIYCSPGLVQAVSGKINFEALPPIRVKGRSQPVAVYHPGEARLAQAETLFVGRQTEIAVLEQVVETVSGGEGQVLVVEGEAGIGKSRLLEALIQVAQAHHLPTLLGAGQSIEQQTPYRVWRDVFAKYFGRQDPSALLQQLAPEHTARLPLLNDVLGTRLPENDLTGSLSAALRQQNLGLLLTALLRARAPLVIVLEDAHWCDSLSWQFALQLARARLPLLLVIVARPTPNETFQALKTLAGTKTLRVEALDRNALKVLIADRLQVHNGGLPRALVNSIYARSGGNPFFAEELLLSLRLQTPEVLQASETALAEILNALPDSLHGLILARMDSLPSERQFVLKVAAVIGRSFTVAPLEHALEHFNVLIQSVLTEHLAALQEADFTVLETLLPELSYVFKHIITQEAAYQTLLFSQRRELHLLVATWYEENWPENFPLLVYHYHQAEAWEMERRAAWLAGGQAARRYANTEALGFFSRALELTTPGEWKVRYELLLAREAVLHLIGDRAAQGQDLEQLARLADQLCSAPKQAEAFYRRARYSEAIADFRRAILAARASVAAAEGANALEIEAAAHLIWGRALMRQDLEGARQQLELALDLAKTCGDRHQQAEALGWLGRLLPDRNPALAQEQLNQALALSRELNDRQFQGQMLHHLAVFAAAIHDDYGQAIDCYRQAIAIFQSIGDLNSEASSSYNLAVNLLHMGQFEEARACALVTQKLSELVNDQEQAAFSLEILGRLALYQEEPARAQVYFEQAAALVQPLGNDGLQGGILTNLGESLLRQGAFSQAETCLQQARTLREALLGSQFTVDELAGLAHLEQLRGNLPQAGEYARQFLTILQSAPTLSQANDPARDVLTIYGTLTAIGHAFAAPLLAYAAGEINRRAGLITDPRLRASFLENVPEHRALLKAYLRAKGT
jgi:predicted ATPase/class 3 adenylate cyclase